MKNSPIIFDSFFSFSQSFRISSRRISSVKASKSFFKFHCSFFIFTKALRNSFLRIANLSWMPVFGKQMNLGKTAYTFEESENPKQLFLTSRLQRSAKDNLDPSYLCARSCTIFTLMSIKAHDAIIFMKTTQHF